MEYHLKYILLTIALTILSLRIQTGPENFCFKKINEPKAMELRESDKNRIITNPMMNWNDNYERTIEFLKKHEGFAGGKPYICPGGYNTIGYGHLILKGENFEELTRKQADSLLRADFNRALRLVDKNVNISGSRKLAIAHFIFARGIGTFLNSGLIDRIERDEPIDDLLMGYCYYKNIDGKRIVSQQALKIRNWELALFNRSES